MAAQIHNQTVANYTLLSDDYGKTVQEKEHVERETGREWPSDEDNNYIGGDESPSQTSKYPTRQSPVLLNARRRTLAI